MHSSPAGRVLKYMGSSSALLAQGPRDCVPAREAIHLSSPAGTPGSWFFTHHDSYTHVHQHHHHLLQKQQEQEKIIPSNPPNQPELTRA